MSVDLSASVPQEFRYAQPRPLRYSGLISFGFFLSALALSLVGLALNRFSGELDLFLLPWMLLVATTTFAPTFYLYFKRRLAFYHPLVYGAVLGIFPGFVIGPIAITVGVYDTYSYSLISDPKFYLPLTLVYVAVGFASLAVGFTLPIGRRLGQHLFAKLPAWDWSFEHIRVPAIFLVAIGQVGLLAGVQVGSWGYNMPEEVSVWGFALVSLGTLGTFAQLVLWFTIFRAQRLTPAHWLFVLLLIGVAVVEALIGGNKGGLFWKSVFVFTIYLLAGRQLPLQRVVLIGLIVGPLVLAGVSYGNAFRTLKGSEKVVGLADYLNLVTDTTRLVLASDWGETISKGIEAVFQRTEIVTHFGVIVANYERLAPLEEEYGIANNIVIYVATSFIPRFVWQDKPIISNARGLAALYFENPFNSYATTPFGDLLRNFGPIGIPIGMAILGIVLAAIYQLVVHQPTTAWRAGLYYALLTCVSYEGFYGSIFPAMIRAAFVVLVGGVFLRLWIGRVQRPITGLPLISTQRNSSVP